MEQGASSDYRHDPRKSKPDGYSRQTAKYSEYRARNNLACAETTKYEAGGYDAIGEKRARSAVIIRKANGGRDRKLWYQKGGQGPAYTRNEAPSWRAA